MAFEFLRESQEGRKKKPGNAPPSEREFPGFHCETAFRLLCLQAITCWATKGFPPFGSFGGERGGRGASFFGRKGAGAGGEVHAAACTYPFSVSLCSPFALTALHPPSLSPHTHACYLWDRLSRTTLFFPFPLPTGEMATRHGRERAGEREHPLKKSTEAGNFEKIGRKLF